VAFHVDLAGVLFIVWGALITLIGLSTLALGAAATSLAASPSSQGQFAAGVIAATFTALAVIAIIWGVAHIMVGLPYGTVLGCYALWALLHQGGRKLFAEH
jgi:hypothetical protein